ELSGHDFRDADANAGLRHRDVERLSPTLDGEEVLMQPGQSRELVSVLSKLDFHLGLALTEVCVAKRPRPHQHRTVQQYARRLRSAQRVAAVAVGPGFGLAFGVHPGGPDVALAVE